MPVDFIVFPGEGHGIEDLRMSLALYAVIEKFLAKQLGGRVESIGEEIKDSFMQWRSKFGAGGMINKQIELLPKFLECHGCRNARKFLVTCQLL